jgi:hypothetical protein
MISACIPAAGAKTQSFRPKKPLSCLLPTPVVPAAGRPQQRHCCITSLCRASADTCVPLPGEAPQSRRPGTIVPITRQCNRARIFSEVHHRQPLCPALKCQRRVEDIPPLAACGDPAHHCMCSVQAIDIILTKVPFRKYHIPRSGTTETLRDKGIDNRARQLSTPEAL